MAGLTIDNPVKFLRVLNSGNVIPGDIIYLRGGVYSGEFTSLFSGDKSTLVTVKPYPGETVIIDGKMTINGDYTRWEDIIFRYSGWETRTTAEAGSPESMPITKRLTVFGNHNEIINCTMHDLAGFNLYSVNGTKIYGNVIYNFGYSGPDRGHVHGIYTANDGTTEILIKDNIIFQNFSTGIKLYGTQAMLDNYRVERNTVFNNGILYDRGQGNAGAHVWWNLLAGDVHHTGNRIQWLNNMTFHSLDVFGLFSETLGTNCLSWGKHGLDSPVITGNYLAGRGVNMSGTAVGQMIAPTYVRNTHIGPAPLLQIAYEENNTWLDWPGTIDITFLAPNEHRNTRANVTVYNWSESNAVEADLTTVTGLNVGDSVTVANVQNYFVDIQTLMLDANKKIVIDMQVENRTVAEPYQWDAPISTFPLFGAFVIEKV